MPAASRETPRTTSLRFDDDRPMVSRLHLLIIDMLAACVALRIGSEVVQPHNKRYT